MPEERFEQPADEEQRYTPAPLTAAAECDTAAEGERLAADIAAVVARFRVGVRWSVAITVAVVTVVVACIVYGLVAGAVAPLPFATGLAALDAVRSIALGTRRWLRARADIRRLVDGARRMSGIGALVGLLDAFQVDTAPLHDPYTLELATPLLAAVQPADAGALEPRHRRLLRRFLASPPAGHPPRRRGALGRPGDEVELGFRLAVLQALERIGEPEDVRVVMDLADSPGTAQSQSALREAARAALPAIVARAEAAATAQTLVRPSQPTDGKTGLLRPASGGTEDQSSLLRPADDVNDAG